MWGNGKVCMLGWSSCPLVLEPQFVGPAIDFLHCCYTITQYPPDWLEGCNKILVITDETEDSYFVFVRIVHFDSRIAVTSTPCVIALGPLASSFANSVFQNLREELEVAGFADRWNNFICEFWNKFIITNFLVKHACLLCIQDTQQTTTCGEMEDNLFGCDTVRVLPIYLQVENLTCFVENLTCFVNGTVGYFKINY